MFLILKHFRHQLSGAVPQMQNAQNSCRNVLSLEFLELVAQRCSVKEVFLKIYQNSQENNCVGVLQLYLKKKINTGVFLWSLQKILRTSFLKEHKWWLLLYFDIKFVNILIKICSRLLDKIEKRKNYLKYSVGTKSIKSLKVVFTTDTSSQKKRSGKKKKKKKKNR